jgi:hypothetical protein
MERVTKEKKQLKRYTAMLKDLEENYHDGKEYLQNLVRIRALVIVYTEIIMAGHDGRLSQSWCAHYSDRLIAVQAQLWREIKEEGRTSNALDTSMNVC